jgi:hypothetical protein
VSTTFPPEFNFGTLIYFVLCRSAIEIDTRNPEHPKLNLEVVIDGKVAYKWVSLLSYPSHMASGMALIDFFFCK